MLQFVVQDHAPHSAAGLFDTIGFRLEHAVNRGVVEDFRRLHEAFVEHLADAWIFALQKPLPLRRQCNQLNFSFLVTSPNRAAFDKPVCTERLQVRAAAVTSPPYWRRFRSSTASMRKRPISLAVSSADWLI